MDTSKWNMVLEEKNLLKQGWLVPLFSSSETLGQKDLGYFPDQPPYCGFIWPLLCPQKPQIRGLMPLVRIMMMVRGTSDWGSSWLSGEQGGSAPREGIWDEVLSDTWVVLADLLQSFLSVLERVYLSSSMPSLSRVSNLGNHMHLMTQMVKNLPAVQETWVWSLDEKISWRREWPPTPVFLPGKSHGQRSLVGCSPYGHKELDTT